VTEASTTAKARSQQTIAALRDQLASVEAEAEEKGMAAAALRARLADRDALSAALATAEADGATLQKALTKVG